MSEADRQRASGDLARQVRTRNSSAGGSGALPFESGGGSDSRIFPTSAASVRAWNALRPAITTLYIGWNVSMDQIYGVFSRQETNEAGGAITYALLWGVELNSIK